MPAAEKLHTACDECRTRKLKCSRETPRCARCCREELGCVYSPRQQMGRPRKRRREDEAATSSADAESEEGLPVADNLHDFDVTLEDLTALPEFAGFGMGIAGEEVRRLHGNGGDAGVDCSQQEVGFFDTSMMTPISNLDFSVDPPIDPSLWDPQHTLIHSQPQYQPERDSTDSTIISCTCLSLTYLTVTDLQSVSTFSFPLVIQPLRKAMATLETLVHCSICPLDPFSAIQNIASFSALFRAITSRFSKVLHEVDLEAARLAERGAKKSYRIGDNSTALMHMHTGTPDCPMGFDVDLEPQDWKRLVKTALRMEVYGGAGRALWLMGLLSEAEQRQKRWHSEGEFQCEERRRLVGKTTGSTCHALGSEHMRVLVDMLNFE